MAGYRPYVPSYANARGGLSANVASSAGSAVGAAAGGIASIIPGILNALVAGAGEAPQIAAAFGDKHAEAFVQQQQAAQAAQAAAQQQALQAQAQAQSSAAFWETAKTAAPYVGGGLGLLTVIYAVTHWAKKGGRK